MRRARERLIVVSNRLPYVFQRGENGKGGEEALGAAGKELGIELRGVNLDAVDVDNFYNGFCNEIIWPLFHDLQALCVFAPQYWRSYREVNRRFAEVVVEASGKADFVWV